MLWGGSRAPFTLIGGYLGAGKTTVLNGLIRAAGGRRWAVLVNDVGAVNVDATLIASHDGDTLALTNGCVCCSIADDLGMTLESIRGWAEPPDHVVMELSGVAEPARVAPWASTAGFRLDGVVVVVDAEQVGEQLAHEVIGDAVAAQIAAADVLLLSKCDLTDDDGRAAAVAVAQHSGAPIVRTDHGAVDPSLVLGVDVTGGEVPSGTTPEHDVAVTSLGEVTSAELRRFVDALPDDVLRAKGVIRCSDQDAPSEVHVVGRRRTVRTRPDLVADDENRLVVVRLPVR